MEPIDKSIMFKPFGGQQFFKKSEMERRFDEAITDMEPNELALTFSHLLGTFVFLDEATIHKVFKGFKKQISTGDVTILGGKNQRSFERNGRDWFYIVISSETNHISIDPLGMVWDFNVCGMIYIFKHRVNRDAMASYLCNGRKKIGTDTYCTAEGPQFDSSDVPIQTELVVEVPRDESVGGGAPVLDEESCGECLKKIIDGNCECVGESCIFCGQRNKCECK